MEGKIKTINKSKDGSEYQGVIVLDIFIKHSSNQVNTSFEQDTAFALLKYIITFNRALERLKELSLSSHSIHLLTSIFWSSRFTHYCHAQMPVIHVSR